MYKQVCMYPPYRSFWSVSWNSVNLLNCWVLVLWVSFEAVKFLSHSWFGHCPHVLYFTFYITEHVCTDPSPYHPDQPFGWALRARRPRWSRTCWPNTLGTGTFARLANQKPGNEESAVWLLCWSAAMLQCLLSTVGESGRGDMKRCNLRQPHQCGTKTKTWGGKLCVST